MGTLLKPAVVEQAAAKIGGFGPGGSGKSVTMTLIAIALSKAYHKGAPVALFDTERASDWLLDIYKTEGVQLLRHKGRAFTDLRQVHREAVEAGACALIVDSYSHPWAELQQSLKKRLNVRKLEFHHMQELQELWGEWVTEFLNSPIHVLLAGRLAYEWENEVDAETGKMGFHKSGTKMRSEKDAGYEPHLLFEMEAVRQLTEEKKVGRKTKRVDLKAGGRYVHKLHVLKDRAMVLNGRTFEFPDINAYKAGDYKAVFAALKPHFDKMNIGGLNVEDTTRTSAALFGYTDEEWRGRVKKVEIALEEIKEHAAALWPGSSDKMKASRRTFMEEVFLTPAWSAVESKPLETLEYGVKVLKTLREIAVDAPPPDDAAGVPAFIQKAIDKIEASKSDLVRAHDAQQDDMPVL